MNRGKLNALCVGSSAPRRRGRGQNAADRVLTDGAAKGSTPIPVNFRPAAMSLKRLLPVSVALAILAAVGPAGAAPFVSAALERKGLDIDPSLTPDVPPPSADATDAAQGPFQTVPLASLSATRERPLFSVTRRPPPPPPAPMAAAPSKAGRRGAGQARRSGGAAALLGRNDHGGRHSGRRPVQPGDTDRHTGSRRRRGIGLAHYRRIGGLRCRGKGRECGDAQSAAPIRFGAVRAGCGAIT